MPVRRPGRERHVQRRARTCGEDGQIPANVIPHFCCQVIDCRVESLGISTRGFATAVEQCGVDEMRGKLRAGIQRERDPLACGRRDAKRDAVAVFLAQAAAGVGASRVAVRLVIFLCGIDVCLLSIAIQPKRDCIKAARRAHQCKRRPRVPVSRRLRPASSRARPRLPYASAAPRWAPCRQWSTTKSKILGKKVPCCPCTGIPATTSCAGRVAEVE